MNNSPTFNLDSRRISFSVPTQSPDKIIEVSLSHDKGTYNLSARMYTLEGNFQSCTLLDGKDHYERQPAPARYNAKQLRAKWAEVSQSEHLRLIIEKVATLNSLTIKPITIPSELIEK